MPTGLINWLWGDLQPAEKHNVARFLLWVIIVVHISWACGWIPGMQGFAFADDVDRKVAAAVDPLKAEVREIDRKLSRVEREVVAARIATMEKMLFDLRKAQCTAIARQNPEAVEFYARHIQEVKSQYFAATSREYQAPTCAEVGTE